MVIKTKPCSFSEFNIYPGHGVSYIRRDGTPYVFITGKARCMFNQRKKPMKLKWTCAWRKLHKKRTEHAMTGKRTRRVKKIERAVMGTDFAAIKTRRNETSAQREAARKKAGGSGPTYSNAIKYVALASCAPLASPSLSLSLSPHPCAHSTPRPADPPQPRRSPAGWHTTAVRCCLLLPPLAPAAAAAAVPYEARKHAANSPGLPSSFPPFVAQGRQG